MPSQSASGGAPRRLSVDGGTWVLEVIRHVNVGQDLVRPTVERLSGNRQISAYFKSNPDQEALGRAAQKLMHAPSGNDNPSYTAVGAEWVRNSVPPPRAAPERGHGEAPPVSVEQQLDDISARLSALVALQEGLLVRLARLEARVAGGAMPESERVGRSEVAFDAVSSSAPLEGSEPEGAEIDSSEPPPGHAALSEPAAHVEEPSASAAGSAGAGSSAEVVPAPARAAEPASGAAPLELPPAAELAKCIALLVGNVSIEGSGEMELSATTSDHYAAGLEADDGKLVGLVIMDLKAAVFLGGTLMMQPKEQLEQQFAARAPEQDSIAASAEICNALSSAVNGTQTGHHVRAGSLAKFEFGSHPWAAAPAQRRDLLDSFGGRTSVLSHPLV